MIRMRQAKPGVLRFRQQATQDTDHEEHLRLLRLQRRQQARLHRTRDRLGDRIAKEGLQLVYGGGNVGLMGIVADAVLAAGGEVVGVIPEQLVNWEVAHKGVTRLEVVANMHERKKRMFDLSDAFVALPGGFGTLDEMFEMLTWRQLGIGDKPCAFLDVEGFYTPLMGMIDRMVEERFLHPEQRNDLWHGDDLDAMVAWMRAYTPAQADKWMDEKRRTSLR